MIELFSKKINIAQENQDILEKRFRSDVAILLSRVPCRSYRSSIALFKKVLQNLLVDWLLTASLLLALVMTILTNF